MLEVKERYVLRSFPLVVDPVALSLEVQTSLCKVLADGQTERPGPKPSWRQLQRVSVKHDTFPFALDSSMVHIFGLELRVEDCPFLLVYDAAGVLRYRIDKEDREFVPYRIPEELNGKRVIKPSVRVTFDDPADAQTYLSLVESVRAGGDNHPEVCDFIRQVIQRSAGVVFTSVAQKP